MLTFTTRNEDYVTNVTTVKNELQYDEHGLSVGGCYITITKDVSRLFGPDL